MDDHLPEFYRLLGEAHAASGEAASAEAPTALIRHVMANGDHLIASLSGHLGVAEGTVVVDDTDVAPGN